MARCAASHRCGPLVALGLGRAEKWHLGREHKMLTSRPASSHPVCCETWWKLSKNKCGCPAGLGRGRGGLGSRPRQCG